MEKEWVIPEVIKTDCDSIFFDCVFGDSFDAENEICQWCIMPLQFSMNVNAAVGFIDIIILNHQPR